MESFLCDRQYIFKFQQVYFVSCIKIVFIRIDCGYYGWKRLLTIVFTELMMGKDLQFSVHDVFGETRYFNPFLKNKNFLFPLTLEKYRPTKY